MSAGEPWVESVSAVRKRAQGAVEGAIERNRAYRERKVRKDRRRPNAGDPNR